MMRRARTPHAAAVTMTGRWQMRRALVAGVRAVRQQQRPRPLSMRAHRVRTSPAFVRWLGGASQAIGIVASRRHGGREFGVTINNSMHGVMQPYAALAQRGSAGCMGAARRGSTWLRWPARASRRWRRRASVGSIWCVSLASSLASPSLATRRHCTLREVECAAHTPPACRWRDRTWHNAAVLAPCGDSSLSAATTGERE
jgi:hypothetical protein